MHCSRSLNRSSDCQRRRPTLGAFDEAVRNVATFAVYVVLPLPKARMIVTKRFPRLTIGFDRIVRPELFSTLDMGRSELWRMYLWG